MKKYRVITEGLTLSGAIGHIIEHANAPEWLFLLQLIEPIPETAKGLNRVYVRKTDVELIEEPEQATEITIINSIEDLLK